MKLSWKSSSKNSTKDSVRSSGVHHRRLSRFRVRSVDDTFVATGEAATLKVAISYAVDTVRDRADAAPLYVEERLGGAWQVKATVGA